MAKRLATPYAFLDANVYVAANFGYAGQAFDSLRSHVAAGAIQPLTTDITLREVKANAERSLKAAAAAAQSFRQKGMTLRSTGLEGLYDALFTPIDLPVAVRSLGDTLDSFVADLGIEVIPVSLADTTLVFDRHFSTSAPFEEGAKKAEFPDAFVLAPLEAWGTERKRRLYVVSGDKGVIAACQGSGVLIPLESLDALVELATLESEHLVGVARAWYRASVTKLLKQVTDEFGNLGFVLEEDGDVVSLEGTEAAIQSVSLISIDEAEAVFSLSVVFSFQVEIEFADSDTGIWDSEDKVWLFRETFRKRGPREVVLPVHVVIALGDHDPKASHITSTDVNGGTDVLVEFYGEDEPVDAPRSHDA